MTKKSNVHIWLELNTQQVEKVSRQNCLSQIITEDGECIGEIKRCLGQAGSVFNSKESVPCCCGLKMSTKKRILWCYVWQVLMYGAETQIIDPDKKKLFEALEI